MKRFCKITGTILSIIGFVGIFATAETAGLQLILTGSAILILLAGYKLLDSSGALDEITF